MAGIVRQEIVSEGTDIGAPTDVGVEAANTLSTTVAINDPKVLADDDNIGTVGFYHSASSFTFTDADVSVGGDTITETAHGMAADTVVHLTNGTAGDPLPAPLSAYRPYFVVNPTTNNFQLSLTPGGSVIDITSVTGGGTHTVVKGAHLQLPAATLNANRIVRMFSRSSGDAFVMVSTASGLIEGTSLFTFFGRGSVSFVSVGDSDWSVIEGPEMKFDIDITEGGAASDYTSGAARASVSGKQVDLTIDASGHASLSQANTAGPMIPLGLRPTEDYFNVYLSGNVIGTIFLNSSGLIETRYRDYSGTLTAQTTTTVQGSASYTTSLT